MTWDKRLRTAEAVVAGTCLVLMVVLIFSGGIARLAGQPMNWTTDAATCLFAWGCFLCADIAWRRDKLMAVQLVTARLAPASQHALRLVNYAIIVAFDAVGLPGFQFIQDPVEYSTRTHHSNVDTYERLQEEDLRKNAVIVASFVYHAANRDQLLPRKPLPRATPAGRGTTAAAR